MLTPNTLSAWINYLEQLNPNHIELGLDRIKPVATQLGLDSFIKNPRQKPTIITVAGTNGKGSTVTLTTNIFKTAGYQVGTYTSPHLWEFTERIQINGKPIDKPTLCAAFSKVEQARANTHLTYFEFTTLAALSIFQQKNLDIVVLEVGMGGRLDAVNMVDADIAVITTIDLDHQAWLGETREQIAQEKAGICRQNAPLICGKHIPQTAYKIAEQLNCPTFTLGIDFDIQADYPSPVLLREPTFAGRALRPALRTDAKIRSKRIFPARGEMIENLTFSLKNIEKLSHILLPAQVPAPATKYVTLLPKTGLIIDNIALSLMVQQLLSVRYPVTSAQVDVALSTSHLPGRQQLVEKPVWQLFDVAHNPQSIRCLAQRLKAPHQQPTYAVFSMLRDKTLAESIAPIKPYIDAWYIAGLPGERGFTADELLQKMQQQVSSPVLPYPTVRAAHHAACLAAKQNNARVVIFGSFHTVAAILGKQYQG